MNLGVKSHDLHLFQFPMLFMALPLKGTSSKPAISPYSSCDPWKCPASCLWRRAWCSFTDRAQVRPQTHPCIVKGEDVASPMPPLGLGFGCSGHITRLQRQEPRTTLIYSSCGHTFPLHTSIEPVVVNLQMHAPKTPYSFTSTGKQAKERQPVSGLN